MYSMTGFGRASIEKDGRKLTVELKSVNHRYLDINMRLHRSISFAEDVVRDVLKTNLNRGHVDVYMYYQNQREDAKCIKSDTALALAYSKAINEIKNIIDSQEPISAIDISKLPDVLLIEDAKDDEDAVKDLIREGMNMAVVELLKLRDIEGSKLRIDLSNKLDDIEKSLAIVIADAPLVVEEYRQKLNARISELLKDNIELVDQNKLSLEVAFFADKSSIDEEIQRLGSHLSLIRDNMVMDEPVGRRMDFIVQEINREVNTICSKSSRTSITNAALEMKNLVEKIREQVQNIE